MEFYSSQSQSQYKRNQEKMKPCHFKKYPQRKLRTYEREESMELSTFSGGIVFLVSDSDIKFDSHQ